MEDPDFPVVEKLSRETKTPVEAVFRLYRHERDELNRTARITNYVSLLAARRVRQQLLHDTIIHGYA